MRDELRDAKSNRDAAVALVVFSPAHAPAGIAPFDLRAGDVYCVVDPAAPDAATLEAAVRLARLLALQTLRERDVEVDAAAIAEALNGVREQLETLRALKLTLTSIGTSARDVYAGLDKLRDGILARLAEAEAELRTQLAPPPGGVVRLPGAAARQHGMARYARASRVHREGLAGARCSRMPRSMWKGAIQFGLVTIPVKMYLATESKGVSFNMLHAACHGRIQMKTYCPTDDEIIERSDTVRGYEVAPDQYVVITDDDLASVPLKTVRSIEIEQFVPIDSSGEATRFVKQAYYLEPEPVARKAFFLLRQVLARAGSSGRLQDRPARSRAARRPRPVRQHDHAVDAVLARRGPLGRETWRSPRTTPRSSPPSWRWPSSSSA